MGHEAEKAAFNQSQASATLLIDIFFCPEVSNHLPRVSILEIKSSILIALLTILPTSSATLISLLAFNRPSSILFPYIQVVWHIRKAEEHIHQTLKVPR